MQMEMPHELHGKRIAAHTCLCNVRLVTYRTNLVLKLSDESYL